jgi:hypothetical protein
LRSGGHVHADFVSFDLSGDRAVNHRAFDALLQDKVGARGYHAEGKAEKYQGLFHSDTMLLQPSAKGKQKKLE